MQTWMEQIAKQILLVLTNNGHQAFLVGGYVRDVLLNKPIQDIDIATSALPEQVIALFAHTIPTGLKHGTVTVRMEDMAFEVTTFRKESDYEQFRRPAQVEYVNELELDLARRDFTMNAMAMDLKGNVIDPFHGQDDIRAGILRSVGDSKERFQEDALRMLRCIRFAANYRLRIERNTWDGLLIRRDLLRHIAMERVGAEFKRMIEGEDPFGALQMLLDSDLLLFTKTGLPQKLVVRSAKEIPVVLQALGRLSNSSYRWFVLFAAMEMVATDALNMLRSFAMPSRQLNDIIGLLKLDEWLRTKLSSNCSDELMAQRWKEAALAHGEQVLHHWLTVVQACPCGFSDSILQSTKHKLLIYGSEWLADMPVLHMKELDLTGRELAMRIKAADGPWIAQLLNQLLLDAAFGRVRNQKDELLRRAEIYYREWYGNA